MAMTILDVHDLARRAAHAGPPLIVIDLDASGTVEEVEAAFSSLPDGIRRGLLDGEGPFVLAFPDAASALAAFERIEADLTASGAYGRGSFDLVGARRTISFDLEDMARSTDDHAGAVDLALAA
jgi:hypothetical protein